MTSVRESAGWWWRPAADGRLWPVSCEDAGPQVTVVVRCDLIIRGLDVALAVKSLEGYPPPMAFHRWASGGSAVSSPMRAWILRLAAAAAPRISVRTMIQVIGGFFLPPSPPAWSSTTTVAGPAWESSDSCSHGRHGTRSGQGQGVRSGELPDCVCRTRPELSVGAPWVHAPRYAPSRGAMRTHRGPAWGLSPLRRGG
jgi:hypothetical protein